MGLFGSLLSRVFGNAGANPYAATVAARIASTPGNWTKVSSSNVDAIRWFPGRAVLGVKDPKNVAQPGPQGGAAVLGGIKTADERTHTPGVPVAFSGDVEIKPDTLGTLEVRFLSGWQYQYMNVPNKVFVEFVGASSKGKFVHKRLRGAYTYRRVA